MSVGEQEHSSSNLESGAPGAKPDEGQELLSEADAASRGAVSIDTLRMFAQCGLLTPVVRDGSSFFTAAEIATLFYSRAKDESLAFIAPEGTVPAPIPLTERDVAPATAKPVLHAAEVPQNSVAPELASAVNESVVESADRAATIESETQIGEAVPTQREERPFGDPTLLLDHLLNDATNQLFSSTPFNQPTNLDGRKVDFVLKGSPDTDSTAKSDKGAAARAEKQAKNVSLGEPGLSRGEQFGAEDAAVFGSDSLSADRTQFSATSADSISGALKVTHGGDLVEVNQAFIEVNKGLKEQIQILRDERDWLRRRVEQLENRSEREQMIHLSESETIRSLVSKDKRSFWQRALPWLGWSSSNDPESR